MKQHDDSERFASQLRDGLEHIATSTPVRHPGRFDRTNLISDGGYERPKTSTRVLVASALVVAVGGVVSATILLRSTGPDEGTISSPEVADTDRLGLEEVPTSPADPLVAEAEEDAQSPTLPTIARTEPPRLTTSVDMIGEDIEAGAAGTQPLGFTFESRLYVLDCSDELAVSALGEPLGEASTSIGSGDIREVTGIEIDVAVAFGPVTCDNRRDLGWLRAVVASPPTTFGEPLG